MDLLSSIIFDCPTSVDSIGIFKNEASNTACGQPSSLELTMYKSLEQYILFNFSNSANST